MYSTSVLSIRDAGDLLRVFEIVAHVLGINGKTRSVFALFVMPVMLSMTNNTGIGYEWTDTVAKYIVAKTIFDCSN